MYFVIEIFKNNIMFVFSFVFINSSCELLKVLSTALISCLGTGDLVIEPTDDADSGNAPRVFQSGSSPVA